MKILLTLERYTAAGGGVYEVIRKIAHGLRDKNHEVHIASLVNTVTMEDYGLEFHSFNIQGNLARGLNGDVQEYRKFLKDSGFDIILNYAVQQPMTDAALLYAHEIKTAKKVLIPCGYSGLKWPEYAQFYKMLPSYLAEYDLQIFHAGNYRDINYAKEHGFENYTIIPNGYDDAISTKDSTDISFRALNKIDEETFMILNVANYTGIKGHLELFKTYIKLKTKQKTTLVSIGHDLNKRRILYLIFAKIFNRFQRKKRILMTRCSRENVIKAYQEADLFLFLSKIEYSPVVLFEAIGAELPFLSSECGNAKEIVEWTQAGEIVNSTQTEDGFTKVSIKDAAQKTETFITDESKRQTMIEKARAHKHEYCWSGIVEKYEDVFQKLNQNSNIETLTQKKVS